MIEVTIDSIRVSLMSQHRVAILKDGEGERYLPIWIGPCEADAITVELQEMEMARPLTHDILATTIAELGGVVSHILIRDLRNDVFYANILVDRDGERLEIDARPSDAMALAVRAQAPIYVEEKVMEQAGITPEEDIEEDLDGAESNGVDDKDLSVFMDFVDTLDLDDLDSDEEKE
jgi:hypothetical protein